MANPSKSKTKGKASSVKGQARAVKGKGSLFNDDGSVNTEALNADTLNRGTFMLRLTPDSKASVLTYVPDDPAEKVQRAQRDLPVPVADPKVSVEGYFNCITGKTVRSTEDLFAAMVSCAGYLNE